MKCVLHTSSCQWSMDQTYCRGDLRLSTSETSGHGHARDPEDWRPLRWPDPWIGDPYGNTIGLRAWQGSTGQLALAFSKSNEIKRDEGLFCLRLVYDVFSWRSLSLQPFWPRGPFIIPFPLSRSWHHLWKLWNKLKKQLQGEIILKKLSFSPSSRILSISTKPLGGPEATSNFHGRRAFEVRPLPGWCCHLNSNWWSLVGGLG